MDFHFLYKYPFFQIFPKVKMNSNSNLILKQNLLNSSTQQCVLPCNLTLRNKPRWINKKMGMVCWSLISPFIRIKCLDSVSFTKGLKCPLATARSNWLMTNSHTSNWTFLEIKFSNSNGTQIVISRVENGFTLFKINCVNKKTFQF